MSGSDEEAHDKIPVEKHKNKHSATRHFLKIAESKKSAEALLYCTRSATIALFQ